MTYGGLISCGGYPRGTIGYEICRVQLIATKWPQDAANMRTARPGELWYESPSLQCVKCYAGEHYPGCRDSFGQPYCWMHWNEWLNLVWMNSNYSDDYETSD